MCVCGAVALAGAAGGLTLAIKKSSVVEDDVQDDGIRGRGCDTSAHVGTRDGRLARTGQFLKNLSLNFFSFC